MEGIKLQYSKAQIHGRLHVTKRIRVAPVAAPTLCTADKRKGQRKYTPRSGERVEAELDRYIKMPRLHLNLVVCC